MYALPVLMLTQNAGLWQHWQQVGGAQWLPARGESLSDLERWRRQGRHLVLMDAALPKLPAWDDPQWAGILQDMQVVVASTRPNDEIARQTLAWGACGYVHAFATVATLRSMLQSVATGHVWLGRSLLSRMLQDLDHVLPPPQNDDWSCLLSAREVEVARYAAIGESNAAIAERLSISERTVRAHMSAIFEKLQINDRLMLALIVHGIPTSKKTKS